MNIPTDDILHIALPVTFLQMLSSEQHRDGGQGPASVQECRAAQGEHWNIQVSFFQSTL